MGHIKMVDTGGHYSEPVSRCAERAGEALLEPMCQTIQGANLGMSTAKILTNMQSSWQVDVAYGQHIAEVKCSCYLNVENDPTLVYMMG